MAEENVEKNACCNSVQLRVLLYQQKAMVLSGVGFEPTPTRVDCDLNAAP